MKRIDHSNTIQTLFMTFNRLESNEGTLKEIALQLWVGMHRLQLNEHIRMRRKSHKSNNKTFLQVNRSIVFSRIEYSFLNKLDNILTSFSYIVIYYNIKYFN
jgi:hypothetical protein